MANSIPQSITIWPQFAVQIWTRVLTREYPVFVGRPAPMSIPRLHDADMKQT